MPKKKSTKEKSGNRNAPDGAPAGGTNHFAHAGSPSDKERAAEYEAGPYSSFAEQVLKGFASMFAFNCFVGSA